ncbi:Diaminopimelate epimerase-like protein [Pseudovirgaria hyperparasitica]|uniref:Diaminopimelate epimerase-like protein n=1 Tax=Pseudovirgaria hyperparasitica TaxID=470096 RepID=A0A6A6W5Q0_9PEZI|nr:Diaminopimelate epimerase-like protein [Pseudovirgaria hyperparasitica]KAF2757276.1 Diaminopimelate epimerase-like protein [Pseudovirgaria hyperparasitica]
MSETTLSFVTVDVFTQTRYKAGNPLPIVYLPENAPITQERKQLIAREFALSETVFLHTPPAAPGTWKIDIFTTYLEHPFAGHPTIGTAVYVLKKQWETSGTQLTQDSGSENINGTFLTKAGRIEISYNPSNGIARAAIPQKHHIHAWRCPLPFLFDKQRDLDPSHLKDPSAGLPVVSIVDGMTFILAELSSLDALSRVLLQHGNVTCTLDVGWSRPQRPFYFYVRLSDGMDGMKRFRTRLFMKDAEDPATGSAACALAGYIARSEGKRGQSVIVKVVQGVEMGRECEIGVEVKLGEDGGVEGVWLSGSAVDVMSGQLPLC